jgi:hypothetical protein
MSVYIFSPSGGCTVNVLEEGLATYFSHKYVEKEFDFIMPPKIQSYERVRELVDKLLKLDPDAIRKIRQNQFKISKITCENILDVVPQFELADAQSL